MADWISDFLKAMPASAPSPVPRASALPTRPASSAPASPFALPTPPASMPASTSGSLPSSPLPPFEALQAQTPRPTGEELLAQYFPPDAAPAPQAPPAPGLLSTVGDTLSSLASGAIPATAQVGGGALSLASTLAGGYPERAWRPVQAAIQNRLFGDSVRPEDITPWAQGTGETAASLNEALSSPGLKAREAAHAGDPYGWVKDPLLGLKMLSGFAPYVAAGAASGGAALPAMLANTGLIAAGSVQNVQSQIQTAPAEQLAQQFPDYPALAAQIGDRAARDQLAETAGLKSAAGSAVLGGLGSLAGGALGGALANRLIPVASRAIPTLENLARPVAEQALEAAPTVLQTLAQGAIRSAPEMGGLMGGMTAAENWAMNRPVGEGVPESMAQGAAMGFLTGGPLALLHARGAELEKTTGLSQPVIDQAKADHLATLSDADLQASLDQGQALAQQRMPGAVRRSLQTALETMGVEQTARDGDTYLKQALTALADPATAPQALADPRAQHALVKFGTDLSRFSSEELPGLAQYATALAPTDPQTYAPIVQGIAREQTNRAALATLQTGMQANPALMAVAVNRLKALMTPTTDPRTGLKTDPQANLAALSESELRTLSNAASVLSTTPSLPLGKQKPLVEQAKGLLDTHLALRATDPEWRSSLQDQIDARQSAAAIQTLQAAKSFAKTPLPLLALGQRALEPVMQNPTLAALMGDLPTRIEAEVQQRRAALATAQAAVAPLATPATPVEAPALPVPPSLPESVKALNQPESSGSQPVVEPVAPQGLPASVAALNAPTPILESPLPPTGVSPHAQETLPTPTGNRPTVPSPGVQAEPAGSQRPGGPRREYRTPEIRPEEIQRPGPEGQEVAPPVEPVPAPAPTPAPSPSPEISHDQQRQGQAKTEALLTHERASTSPPETAGSVMGLSDQPPVVVDKTHDVPFTAGPAQSQPGDPVDTVYIDARIPESIRVPSGEKIPTTPLIVAHEQAEKPLLDQGIPYEKAHEQATAIEKQKFFSDNPQRTDADWVSYQNTLKGHARNLQSAPNEKIPANLDERPYQASGDQKTVAKIAAAQPTDQKFARARQPTASDADYLAAVERGDRATAQRMVEEAARAAGYTVSAYHAGTVEDQFDQKYAGTGLVGTKSGYIFFGSSKKGVGFYAEKGTKRRTRKYWLKFDNLKEFEGGIPRKNADNATVSAFQNDEEAPDGTVTRGVTDGDTSMDVYTIAYNDYGTTEQAKLADPITRDDAGHVIPLSQRFDRNQPDIRYAQSDHAETPVTAVHVTDTLKTLSDDPTVQALLDNGRLKVVERQSELPNSITVREGQRVAAAVDPKTGQVVLIAENFTPAELDGLLQHDVAVHQSQLGFTAPPSAPLRLAQTVARLVGARGVLGEAAFNDTLAQLERLRFSKQADVVKAFETAQSAMKGLGQNPALLREESLAYFLSDPNNKQIPLVRRVVAAVRTFLYRAGFKLQLTTDDLRSLAVSALRSASRTPVQENPNSLGVNSKIRSIIPEKNGAFSNKNPDTRYAGHAEDAEATRQYADVVARYTQPDGTKAPGWLKAPNGQPTNLNERQWVQTRTPLFKAMFGDWEHDPKNAMQAVDANGEPLVLWHATRADFTQFKQKNQQGWHFGTRDAAMERLADTQDKNPRLEKPPMLSEQDHLAALDTLRSLEKERATIHQSATQPGEAIDPKVKADWASGRITDDEFLRATENMLPKVALSPDQSQRVAQIDQRIAEIQHQLHPTGIDVGAQLMPVFLNIRRLRQTPDFGMWTATAKPDAKNHPAWSAIARAKADPLGGLKYENRVEDRGSTSYVVFHPEQIKSAIGNTGAFSPTNPDIRYAEAKRTGKISPAAYRKAIEQGDQATAQRMVDEAARAAGYSTTKQYHGTHSKDFTVFDTQRGESLPSSHLGAFFTPSKQYADLAYGPKQFGGRVVGAYLKLSKPYEMTWEESNGLTDESAKKLRRRLESEGYDSIVLNHAATPEVAVFSSNQIKSADPVVRDDAGHVIPLSQRFNPQVSDIRYAIASPVVKAAQATANRLPDSVKDWGKSLLDSFKRGVVPMAMGTDQERALVKDTANAQRAAQYEAVKTQERLTRDYTPRQLEQLWTALDDSSTAALKLERGGLSRADAKAQVERQGIGLFALPRKMRDEVLALSSRADANWANAQRVGLVAPDAQGLPWWTPRIAALIGEDGTFEKVGKGADGGGSRPLDMKGINFSTTSPNLKQRKHLEAADTEAAMQAKFGPDAGLVRDLRAMPLAMARLEHAIAARELINQIKVISAATGNPETFTLPHPAFQTYQPKLEPTATGKWRAVKDSNGKTVFEKKPIYVSNEFEGPLRALLSTKPGAWYRGAMELKRSAMSMIMFTPLLHFQVVLGKALPAVGGKLLTTQFWREGGRALQDPVAMREWIKDGGLVPLNAGGFHPDIPTALTSLSGHDSGLITKGMGKAVGLVSPKAGAQVEQTLGSVLHFWHQTLLWDQIAKLQLGMAEDHRQTLLAQGVDRLTATRRAADLANRFVGAMPREAMSEGATKLANIALFSRSWTLGNLSLAKMLVTGMPSDTLAQIRRDAGPLAAAKAVSGGRSVAVHALMLDVGLMYATNALLQGVIDYFHRDQSIDQIEQGYVRRLGEAMHAVKENPLNLFPTIFLSHLDPTHDNEPGKEGRIFLGRDPVTGTASYTRGQIGKVGEEYVNWAIHPIDMLLKKLSTLVRPPMEVLANRDWAGKPVYDVDTPGMEGMAKRTGQIVTHIMEAQAPVETLQAAVRMFSGTHRPDDPYKTWGPLLGMPFGSGYPGGPELGQMAATNRRHEAAIQAIRPDVRNQIKDGDVRGAMETMVKAGMSTSQMRTLLISVLAPESRLTGAHVAQFEKVATPEERQKLNVLIGQR